MPTEVVVFAPLTFLYWLLCLSFSCGLLLVDLEANKHRKNPRKCLFQESFGAKKLLVRNDEGFWAPPKTQGRYRLILSTKNYCKSITCGLLCCAVIFLLIVAPLPVNAAADDGKVNIIDKKKDPVQYCERIYSMARIAFDMGRYDDTIMTLSSCIDADPSNDLAYYMRGAAYWKKKQYNLAIGDYTQAISINPTGKYVQYYYSNRGIAYCENGQYDLGIADFDQALALDPKLESAQQSRNNCLEIKAKKPPVEPPNSSTIRPGFYKNFYSDSWYGTYVLKEFDKIAPAPGVNWYIDSVQDWLPGVANAGWVIKNKPTDAMVGALVVGYRNDLSWLGISREVSEKGILFETMHGNRVVKLWIDYQKLEKEINFKGYIWPLRSR